MKRVLLALMCTMALMSCENEESIKSDIDILKEQRSSIRSDISRAMSTQANLKSDIESKRERLKILGIYERGNKPHYILKLRLKQSHISLDLGKHLKDEMNAIEFEIPVDEEFYNSVSVGTNIVDNFRFGSLIMDSSFGSWKMRVINKRIQS